MKTRNLFKAARLPAGYWILALACPQLLIAILLLPSAVAAGGCSPQQRSVLAGEGWSGLALKSNGTVWAWGYNPYGGLGDGTITDRHTPVQVSGLSGVVSVAGEGYSGLALKSDGTVWAWGDNFHGALGDGTTMERHTPVQVSGLCGVASVAGEIYSGLALKSDGTVWAWGDNTFGGAGDGTTTIRLTPGQVSGLSGVAAFDVWVDFSYGGGEAGTFNAPYDSLAVGASLIATNGTLHMKAGTSSETLTITKPMKIEPCGGAATVGR